ncbi:hypothetical protein GHT06_016140 [Daphnia sinensis]|uniref:Fork-head domain-containing protein n=1 Tax=Daphnia sinensis TaxID=1820382 RepID=A0AAD5PTH4_9CRUS|nr:hypothetical protein GHT06_016140 [Daphnia sinensis]
MEMSNRLVGRSQRIYLQTPENGTLLLGLQDLIDNNNHPDVCIVQGHEVYILADGDGLTSSCDERNNLCPPVNQLEVRVIEGDSDNKSSAQDEELTSLSWLQNTNLLQSINLKAAAEQKKIIMEKKPVAKSIEQAPPTESDETESSWDGSNLSYPDATPPQPSPSQISLHSNNGDESSSKPPHSFSTLIFLAIESSASKALPVRDIYSWITQHFPYYRSAPVGWKNSVRHNLSLNKCFYKVECGLNLSKGSFWMVDPQHRPQLIQSLCKVSYIKADLIQDLMKQTAPPVSLVATLPTKTKDLPVPQESTVKQTYKTISPPSSSSIRSNANLPDPKLFPFLSRRLAFNTVEDPDVEVSAAKAMLTLGQSHVMNNNQNESDCGVTNESSSCQSSPSDDHTYSFSPRPLVKPLPRKLHGIIGPLKRERAIEQKLAEHVPDMVRELEISSSEPISYDSSQSPRPVKLKRTSATNKSNGLGRVRARGRGKSRGRGRAKCR